MTEKFNTQPIGSTPAEEAPTTSPHDVKTGDIPIHTGDGGGDPNTLQAAAKLAGGLTTGNMGHVLGAAVILEGIHQKPL